MLDPADARVCVIGLGYVGLPLAVEFGKSLPTVGFDVNAHRIEELRAGRDSTLEVTSDDLAAATSTPLVLIPSIRWHAIVSAGVVRMPHANPRVTSG